MQRRPNRPDVDALVAAAYGAAGTDRAAEWVVRIDQALLDVVEEHDRARLLLARATAGSAERPQPSTMADVAAAAAVFDALGDRRGLAYAAAFGAALTVGLDDIGATVDQVVRALVAVEQVHDDEVASDVLDELGSVLHRIAADERAVELHERAGSAARRSGSRWRVERSARNQVDGLLAAVRLARIVGDADDGGARLVRAEGLARELGSTADTDHFLDEGPRLLADVLCELGRPEEAWLTLLAAPLPEPDTWAYAARLVVEARCLRLLGQPARALAALDEVVALDVLPTDDTERLFVLHERSSLRHEMGDAGGALVDARAATAIVWRRLNRQTAHAVDRVGALAEAEMNRRHLSRSAEVDPLTDVGNRLALERRLDRSGDRPTMAVLAIDVDALAAVNHQHGRAVGDEALAALAALLRLEVRDGDLVARTAGDEFVLVLDGLDLAAADAIAERIRRRVADHDWSPYAAGLRLDVSVGTAAGAGRDARRLVQRADLSLYEAKRVGADRAAS